MSTVEHRGIRFKIYPQDHEPMHVRGHYAETIVVVDLRADGSVDVAKRKDSIIPANAKKSDVRKILDAAAERFDGLQHEWEAMHQ